MKKTGWVLVLSMSAGAFSFVGCGGDDETEGPTDADDLGVAAACEVDDDCPEVEFVGGGGAGGAGDGLVQLSCLTQFTDGYCAIPDCESDLDCPDGSTCVAHDDGSNYCFRECTDKAECNANREGAAEANCSANFDYADPADDEGQKACIPSSSGD
jgi:hypothetical protein